MSSSLFNRIVHTGRMQTDSTYKGSAGKVYANGTDHTSLGLGEPGAIDASGMPYPSQHEEHTYAMPRQIPLVRIGIYDGVVSYDGGPIGDPAGLLIMPTAPGEWGQLYRAGRIYGR